MRRANGELGKAMDAISISIPPQLYEVRQPRFGALDRPTLPHRMTVLYTSGSCALAFLAITASAIYR